MADLSLSVLLSYFSFLGVKSMIACDGLWSSAATRNLLITIFFFLLFRTTMKVLNAKVHMLVHIKVLSAL